MKNFFGFLLLFISLSTFGQTENDPVNWSISSKSLGDDTYEVAIKADMYGEYHTYSQFMSGDEGPIPTLLTFSTGDNFELIGTAEEIGLHTQYDAVWEADISSFSKEALFLQKIKSLNPDSSIIEVVISYMACNESSCIFPDPATLKIDLNEGSAIVEEVEYKTDSAALDLIPNPKNLDLDNPIIEDCNDIKIKDTSEKTETSEDKKKKKEEKSKSSWVLFLLGLGGGLISLITPCVFPMIPLTVSFFTKGGSEKGKGVAKAILYGLSIVAVYVALSIPFYFSGTDPEVLNQISTSATLNLVFFVIFIVFAISFLGYYELTLPSSWANKADKAADLGGFLGVIFMALVLAIVSFSCTGPLLGSVLAGSLKNGPVPITMAMLGFGVGLGLPFTLFAAFPSLLKSLPSSGGWLNTVKVVLGFVELGLALKFLSNADFVFQYGIVLRETFFLVWIILAFATALYLFGFIHFPHDTKGAKIGIARKIIGIVFLSFGIYLSPGVLPEKSQPWSQSLVSGFPPPFWYGWYAENSSKIDGISLDIHDDNLKQKAEKISDLDELIDFIEEHNAIAFGAMHELKNGGNAETLQKKIDENLIHYHITDYYLGLHYAQKVNRPLLIDFTGYACVNCRKMEENVWPKDGVKEYLEEDYIVVSLYVDDKNELPEDVRGKEVTIDLSDGTKKQKKIVTIGDRWSTFETLRFGQVSQPYYVLLSPDEYLLNTPVAYTPDVTEYSKWLECGLTAFELKNEDKVDLDKVESGKEIVVDADVAASPVTWEMNATKTGEGEYEISMTGNLQEGWHTYSQFLEYSDEGPLGTLVSFESSENYELIDAVTEENSHTYFDDTWGTEITEFSGQAIFKQKIKVLSGEEFVLKGNINFMVCKDGACLPPEDAPIELTIKP